MMEKTLLLVASTTSGFELEAAAARQDNALLLTLQSEIKRSRRTNLNSFIPRLPLSIPSISLQHRKSRVGEEIYLPCEYQNRNKHETFCVGFDQLNGQHFVNYIQERIRTGG